MKSFIIEKYILLLGCLTASIAFCPLNTYTILTFLVVLIIDSLAYYFEQTKVRLTLYIILCFLVVFGYYFLPYLAFVMYLPIWYYHNESYISLNKQVHQLRDDAVEMKAELEQRNNDILVHQNDKIQVAMLNERNRISREIHDNVGHMLSRSILQVGALSALEQDPAQKEQLSLLNDSLTQALTDIRNSVHNLYDDSINLYSSINEIISGFPSYKINFDYDMTSTIPIDYRYSFVAIVKEGLSNIAKHSDATEVSIILRQHPAFIQLLIRDNGSCTSTTNTNSPGIGLENIKKRIEILNGTLNITNQHGFQLFISVPYKEGE